MPFSGHEVQSKSEGWEEAQWPVKENQSELDSNIRAGQQEISESEQKNTRARVQGSISQGLEKLNNDEYHGMKNLVQILDFMQLWAEMRKQESENGS